MPRPLAARAGLLYGLAAYGCWGLVPLYFKALGQVSPAEQLAQRIVWTLVLMAVVLTLARRWPDFVRVLRNRSLRRTLTASSALITINWLAYIYGVNTGHMVETSLGYYIAPLASVLLGRMVLGERLRRGQWLAVGLASVGVLILVLAIGSLPWIALALAGSFSLYGLVRKRVPVDGVNGLAVETTILAPFALLGLAVLQCQGRLVFGQADRATDWLLAAGGIVTAVPLICFAQAARRLPLSTLGFLQYLAPTCQFALATGYYGEPFSSAKLFGFLWIWLALVVYSADAIWGRRAMPGQPPEPEPEMELERG